MRIFVTGATGFVGRHLVPLLLERGEVHALVREGTDDSELRRLGAVTHRGALLDRDAIQRASADCALVFHVAGLVAYEDSDVPRLEEVNVRAVDTVLAGVNPAARVVHVSSVAAVGPAPGPDRPADETQPFPPAAERLPYPRTKHAGERIALAAAAAGRDVVVANPAYLLGPGDRYGASAWLVSRYLKGTLPVLIAGGQTFTDVRDVARGLVTLADRGRAGERTILGSRAGNLSYAEFFARVAAVTGVRRRQVTVPTRLAIAGARVTRWPLPPGRVRTAAHWWQYDPAKAERDLGFESRPLDETIAETAADFR